ncbi:MAG: PKD domain-containing protein [Myxococcales bacterium]
MLRGHAALQHQTFVAKKAVAFATLLCAFAANAQKAPSPTPQFDMLGFIQSATLDDGSMCPGVDRALVGGTVTLNGVTMIVPCNTILQMPATAFTWAQLFDPTLAAPVNMPPANGRAAPSGQTGLALQDVPAPFAYPSFEIRVVGNVVRDGAGNKRYVVGLIAPISQQGLNAGAGEITCIDYTNGFLYVGGATARPGESCGAANGARVQMNDPIGRWGLPHSPDPRFMGDIGNTTMHTASGYPICVPRTDPAFNDDPLCPKGNRPLNGDTRFAEDPFLAIGAPLRAFDMPPSPDHFGIVDGPAAFPDARQQLPLEIGDWIDYSGTLAKDALGDDYISAHTVIANLGVFTAPGYQPAYVAIEELLLGTAGDAIPGVEQEATNRIFVVGFTTDPSALIDIDAVDVNPCTGQESLRLLGTVDPASQPVRGRFRFHVLGGAFMPPTREMVAMSYDGTTPASDPGGEGFANGLGSGQYRAPNFDFIFPEGFKFGQPLPPNNFQDMPFLALGSGPLFGTGPIVGQLTPWPGSPAPTPANCTGTGTAPIVSAGADFVVGSSAQVTLLGKVTEDPNAWPTATFAWTQTAGPLVTLDGADTLTPGFVAPTVAFGSVPVTLGFQLTATDQFGTSAATVNVSVVGATDLISGPTAVWKAPAVGGGGGGGLGGGVRGQKGGKLTVTATSSVVSSTVTLTVVGFGGMDNLGAGNYSLNATGIGFPPDTVTIRSSLGAQAVVPVSFK